MIITEYATLKINPNNYKYLISLGYNNIKINDFLEIPVNKLSIGCSYKISVKCDVCGKEKMLSYSRYMKSFNNGGYYACCNKCNLEKRKHACTDEIKEKVKNTCLKKYGTSNYFKTDECKEKIKQTNLKNYGVDNVFKNDEIKKQIQKTNIEKFGVDNPSKSVEIKIKKETTCLRNHGVKSPYQNRYIFEKNLKSGLKIKKFENSELNYQGSYELDFLNIFYNKIDIEKGLTINYEIDNKNKYYHSDYYIPSLDLIVEIKSTYWYNKCKKINEIKEQYAKKDHNYIMILDKNYDDFVKIINHKSQF